MDLKPEKFFKFFEEISEIPRGSGNEKGISDYLVKFAKDRNLEAIQDKALNVIIKKPGTPGYENSPTVILQGHMDMVCEKNKDVEHDFTKDPLKLYVENGELKARGTTLGADNGVAVAAALAILDSNDLKHPPLEALMTTGEEIGLLGAAAVDPGNLDGRLLLNLDSGGEGEFLTACAGGLRADIYLPVTRVDAPSGFEFYVLEVKGLHGGHSGEDIILGRANANVLLSRLLYEIGAAGFYYHLASISGGQKDNAIPREAEAVIAVSDYEGVKDFIEKRRLVVASEYSGIEENIVFRLTKTRPSKVFDYDSLRTVIDLINVSPNGIFKMSAKIEGLVETSNNIAIVSTSENETVVSVSLRSSVASRLEELYNKFEILAERLGGKIQRRAEYPGWDYKSESKLRDVCVAAYEQTSGKETKKKAKVKAIHAGVECGILSDKIPGLDAISFGPIMRDFHTPEEALDIASCGRFYNLTINILERLK
jgi:dipeptidase D